MTLCTNFFLDAAVYWGIRLCQRSNDRPSPSFVFSQSLGGSQVRF